MGLSKIQVGVVEDVILIEKEGGLGAENRMSFGLSKMELGVVELGGRELGAVADPVDGGAKGCEVDEQKAN